MAYGTSCSNNYARKLYLDGLSPCVGCFCDSGTTLSAVFETPDDGETEIGLSWSMPPEYLKPFRCAAVEYV